VPIRKGVARHDHFPIAVILTVERVASSLLQLCVEHRGPPHGSELCCRAGLPASRQQTFSDDEVFRDLVPSPDALSGEESHLIPTQSCCLFKNKACHLSTGDPARRNKDESRIEAPACRVMRHLHILGDTRCRTTSSASHVCSDGAHDVGLQR
jgi:hypothetical protein